MSRVTQIASCYGGVPALQGVALSPPEKTREREEQTPPPRFCCHEGSGCPGPSGTPFPTSVPLQMARNRVSSPWWTPKDPLLVLRLGLCFI